MPDSAPIYTGRQIARGMLGAMAAAAAILAIFVLPTEYGIDPVGAGRLFDVSNGPKSADPELRVDASSRQTPYLNVEEKIEVPAGQALEFKFVVDAGVPLLYSWRATQPIYFEFHGEPTDEGLKQRVKYQMYEKNTAAQSQGYLLPPFTGTHGWYWRNNSFRPIEITISGAGYFEVKGIIR